MSDESSPTTNEMPRPRVFSFDTVAESFEDASNLPWEASEPIREAIMTVVGAGPTTRFLELGAGTGLIALPFIQAGAWYTAVDSSREMLQQLQAKLGDASYPATLLIRDLNDPWPFPDSSYHVIIASRVLHLLELEHVLPEIQRTLAPQGHLVIGRVRRPTDLRVTLRKRLRTLMREMGYEPWPPEGIEKEILARLEALGGQRRGERTAYSWPVTQTARDLIQRWWARPGLTAQAVAPEVKAEMLDRLRAWASQTYGSLDIAETSEQRYVFDMIQF